VPIKTKARRPIRRKGMHVGYLRVSAVDQNELRQLEGMDLDRTFTDKASGKDTKRPNLELLLSFVREGDTVICHSMDRLARNLDDLRKIVLDLTKRGVHVQFVKESLTFTGEDSPMANLLLSVMGAFSEFERALIRERQREGIALAKKRGGVYLGRKRSLTVVQAAEVTRRAGEGESKTVLAERWVSPEIPSLFTWEGEGSDTAQATLDALQLRKPEDPRPGSLLDLLHVEAAGRGAFRRIAGDCPGT
jgi:DNA invertase Pin-like site-specific DNA recombinase